MGRHVIVGSGPVGAATAEHLLARGHEVRMITRSGTGPSSGGPGAGGVGLSVERIAADATDAERLASLAAGAEALYNCASPPYHQWPQLWPALATALLSAAERSGAVLVTMSNLYGYGEVDGPISEEVPMAATATKLRIRADM
jgi:uncharacterized protein YbjT (DUF2867 family)